MQFSDPHGLLPAARLSHRAFYAKATPADAELFDGIVTMHAALTMLLNFPRERADDAVLKSVELQTRHLEQAFVGVCGLLRKCPTFLAMSEHERGRIEDGVLTVKPPLHLQ